MAWNLITSQTGSGVNNLVAPINLNAISLAKLIIIAVSFFDAAAEPTVSDDDTNTYQHLTLYGVNSAACHRVHYCINPTITGGSLAISSNGTSCYQFVYAEAWSADGAITFDQATGSFGSVTSIQAGGLTPSQAGALAWSGLSQQTETAASLSTWAANDAYESSAPVGGNNVGAAYGYDAQSAAAAFQPTWSWNGVSTNAAMTNAVWLEAQGTPPAMGGRFHRIVTRPAAFRPGIAR